MNRIVHFFKEYKLFAMALIAAVVGAALDVLNFNTIANWVLAITAIIALFPLLKGMWEDLRAGTYGVDILAATAIVTAIIMKEYWAAIVIVLMLTGGESLEDYAEKRASRELDALLDRAPQKAHVLRGRKEIDVRVREVKVGDKVIIRPGEIVPVDAVILEGAGEFDESSLTGESLPQLREANSEIMSGSVNVDGVITARALRESADSQYEQIIKLVQNASKSQTPFIRLADRYSIPFTIISFGIAGAAWAMSGESMRFLEVLVVATPCPLILAAPIAVISGMSRSAKNGIIMKTGSALERLAEAKTFAFDKTGTLTRGELFVDGIKTYNGYTQKDVLGIAAGIEQNSTHVLAKAIVAKAEKDKVKIQKPRQIKETAGHGLSAIVGGKQVYIGRLSLLKDNGVELPKSFSAGDITETVSYVSVDGRLAGAILLKDELRPETKKTIAGLRGMGIKHFLMVTGDNKATAKQIAKQAGISEVTAEALPGDKINAVENAKEHPVAFVGDGVNDAPVLTASNVGIALGARGSTAASESADVVIMKDDLSKVVTSVAIAKRTFTIARQSIFIGIGLSVGLMLIFSTGKFAPVQGALIQEVVDIVVIFNALRAHIGQKDEV